MKPLAKFGKNASRKDGLQDRCKPCHAAAVRECYARNPEVFRQRRQDYMLQNPDAVARNAFRQCARQWGLDPDYLWDLFSEHDGRCEICGLTAAESCTKKRRLVMDHDHTTGVFRGFICHGCNTGLGGLKDDPALLVAAIEYLTAHNAKKAA